MLDTYETERKPHARSLIRLARLVGIAMTEGGELGNLLRGVLAPRLHLLPRVSSLVLSGQTAALRRSDLVIRPHLPRGLAGRPCPNAPLGDGRRFDDVAGGRFALVTTTQPAPALSADVEQRGGALITASVGTSLHDWLRRGHATAAIVRPDGTVLRAGRDLPGLCAAIPAFGVPAAHGAGHRDG